MIVPNGLAMALIEQFTSLCRCLTAHDCARCLALIEQFTSLCRCLTASLSILFMCIHVVNALLHKGFSNPYQSRYNLISPYYYQCQTRTRSRKLSQPNTGHWDDKHRHKLLNCSINAKPLGMISETIIPNSGHYINYSITAKPMVKMLDEEQLLLTQ